MTYMSFIPQLREFLKENGYIYTVRKYKMDERYVEVDGVGTCKRIPLGIIEEKQDLLPYVKMSGFGTIEEWWEKINYFIPDKKDIKHLYKVEVGILSQTRMP